MSTPVPNKSLMTWVYVPYEIDLAVVRWTQRKELGLEIVRIQPQERERLRHLLEGQSKIV
jgi:hypothetical protein